MNASGSSTSIEKEKSEARDIYLEAWRRGWAPDPELTVSEWADQNRLLSPEVSPEPGPWRTERVPYLREIMDCFSATNPARRIVFMKASRIGATEAINNAIGYAIQHSPGPILFIQPTDKDARDESKTRVAPMIDASEALSELVSDPRSRDSGNTTLLKEFPGGILRMVGANSKNAFRRISARYVFGDEIDAYPSDVQGEGDPVSLMEKRAANFPRRKIGLTSTPTLKDFSRIEREWKLSDQRRYFVPCPFCGHFDWIRWENIRFEENDPSSAKLSCVSCLKLIEERFKPVMLHRGEWRSTAASSGRTIGFHLSAFYSPLGWKSWSECVAEFLEGKDEPQKLKVWVNTVLGETWEERADAIDAEGLASRKETYAAEVPAGVGILVAAVDVQGDRLEAQVKGYGAGEQSWLIAYHQEHGDPGQDQVWLEMDKFLKQEWTHESGRKLKISCTTVDSGGHHTEKVYAFCRARLERRVFAIRGGNELGKPLVPARPSTRNRYHAKLFTLCVDTGKETIHSRLTIKSPGPGYMHLPEFVDQEYLEQLTAEKALRKWTKGRGMARVWVKIRERNEAFDLEVYCLASLYILGQAVVRSLPARAAALNVPLEGEEAGEPAREKAPRRRRGGWVNSWRS